MKYTVEKIFSNLTGTCLGWSYRTFEYKLRCLMREMRDRIGHTVTGEEYHSLRFIMNPPLYHQFCIVCKMTGHDSDMYMDIPIIQDTSLYIGSTDSSPAGIVRLIYDNSSHHDDYMDCLRYAINRLEIKEKKKMPPKDWSPTTLYLNNFIGLDRGHGFQKVPHIDHVIFNCPATIVFWKDGTKTVVKWDGKGRQDKRQAILYAFIRKIYGEGKPYHNILNEIEEAVK